MSVLVVLLLVALGAVLLVGGALVVMALTWPRGADVLPDPEARPEEPGEPPTTPPAHRSSLRAPTRRRVMQQV